MAFGGPRSSYVRPGAHSTRRQDSRNDLTPCRMALHFVSAGARAPHSDETLGPTTTRGSTHSARRLRSLAFLCSSEESDPAIIAEVVDKRRTNLEARRYFLKRSGAVPKAVTAITR